MKICHIISMDTMDQMGDISRNIFNYCIGEHIWSHIDKKPPKADIYLLECFKNNKYYKKFLDFKRPYKESGVISLVHSSFPCMPAIDSDCVVTISKARQKELKNFCNIDSELIYAGINLKAFDSCRALYVDYKTFSFGKISRSDIGKFHDEWNYMILRLLEKYKKLEYRLISRDYDKLPIIKSNRAKYIDGVKIDNIERKCQELNKLLVYADAHNERKPFVETFNVALLEAMACGLPIVLFGLHQKAMVEVLGNAGIVCYDFEDFEDKLESLLVDVQLRKKLREKALKRARFFSMEKMIKKWNKLFKRFN